MAYAPAILNARWSHTRKSFPSKTYTSETSRRLRTESSGWFLSLGNLKCRPSSRSAATRHLFSSQAGYPAARTVNRPTTSGKTVHANTKRCFTCGRPGHFQNLVNYIGRNATEDMTDMKTPVTKTTRSGTTTTTRSPKRWMWCQPCRHCCSL